MIDRLFQEVQQRMDKEQKDYLRPLYFNNYLNSSLIEIFNKLLSDVKSNVRKSNWMLDGKNLADYSEHIKQLLEHYLTASEAIAKTNGSYTLPTNCSLIQDVLVEDSNILAEKMDLQDFNLLSRSNVSPPQDDSPICSKIGTTIVVAPSSVEDIIFYYLRTPNKAKWTFQEVGGKPMYDPTAQDFADVDAPEILFDELANAIFMKASVSTRDQIAIQGAVQKKSENLQIENKE